MIRRAEGEADLARIVALREAIDPLSTTLLADLLVWRAQADGPLELLAEEDGDAVGFAAAVWHFRGEPVSRAVLGVLPAWRRRGIGGDLLRLLSAHAREQGWVDLELSADEADPDAGPWLERRGFREHQRMVRVVLELADAPEPPDPPPDVTLTDLEARPDLVHAVHGLFVEALPDIPGPPEEPLAFDDWRAAQAVPSHEPRFLVLALVDGELAGYSQVHVYPRVGYHDMTAVARAHRRRGLARTLKLEQIRRARARGLARLVTQMHDDNEPIQRLNEELGYRPASALVTFRGASAVSAVRDAK